MNLYSVLILFKDNLNYGGKEDLPIILKSETIHLHQSMLENVNSYREPQPFFHFERDSVLKNVKVNNIDDNNFVWGWWKKPGESHNELFNIMQKICREEKKINTLLFNKYMRRVYISEINDIFYIPYASSVVVPEKWKHKCPEYYKDTPHFCGAFFSMKLKKELINKKSKGINTSLNDFGEYEEYEKYIIPYKGPPFLKNYIVDQKTFDRIFLNDESVIKQAEGVIEASKEIIEKEITPLKLKLTDQTIFLLREKTNVEKIKELFKNNSDSEISSEFKNLTKDDAVNFIKKMTRGDWKKLTGFPCTIKAVYELFNIHCFPITAIDVKLVSHLISEGIFSSSDELIEQEILIIDWLLSENFKLQRENASKFFKSAWKHSIDKSSNTEFLEYLNILPQLEDISLSTKSMSDKIYRDHLNHNIRAALMASFLVSIIKYNHEDMKIAFFSGLLHDIAHPLSSYNGTIKSIQESLIKLGIVKLSDANSIINGDILRNLVNLVAIISSIPKIEENDIPLPFTKINEIFKMIKPELLYEEIICSMSFEHSLLSASVVLNTIVKNQLSDKDTEFNDGVKKLFANQKEYKDLFQIIQCIALHDRKAANFYRGISKFYELTMTEYFLPVITIIADEIQEWGRPISSDYNSVVKNCDLKTDDGSRFLIEYTCDFEKEKLNSSGYCFIEHFFSKDRIFSRLKKNENLNIQLEIKINIVNGLNLYSGENFKDYIKIDTDKEYVLWPEGADSTADIEEYKEKKIITTIMYQSDKKNICSSIIVFELDKEDRLEKLKKYLNLNIPKIDSIEFTRNDCKIKLNNEMSLKGKIKAYYYTLLNKDKSVIDIQKETEIIEKIGILVLEETEIVELMEIKTKDEIVNNNFHLFPQPHFLDFDWRFSYKSINSILNFISANIDKGKICYLGCPSLALYHKRRLSIMNSDFTLFDKGHFSLKKWLNEGYIDNEKYVPYNVNESVASEYFQKYDVVIMDPPWYKDYYKLFLQRAICFVKHGGIIGVVEYPGYTGKKKKLEDFKEIRDKIFNIDSKIFPFCSIEIAYEIPAFEESWQAHKKFVHSAIGTYRPAYMDFYLVHNPEYSKDMEITPVQTYNNNEKNLIYNNSYIRLIEKYYEYFGENNKWEFFIRDSLERIEKKAVDWIGWSTNNTCVKINNKSKNGFIIKNDDELLSKLKEFEKKKLFPKYQEAL